VPLDFSHGKVLLLFSKYSISKIISQTSHVSINIRDVSLYLLSGVSTKIISFENLWMRNFPSWRRGRGRKFSQKFLESFFMLIESWLGQYPRAGKTFGDREQRWGREHFAWRGAGE